MIPLLIPIIGLVGAGILGFSLFSVFTQYAATLLAFGQLLFWGVGATLGYDIAKARGATFGIGLISAGAVSALLFAVSEALIKTSIVLAMSALALYGFIYYLKNKK